MGWQKYLCLLIEVEGAIKDDRSLKTQYISKTLKNLS